jgi:acetyl-CoA C-acetyltransferase
MRAAPRGIGKVGKGALAEIHPQQLGDGARGYAARNNLDTNDVDDVIWGTSAQNGTQGGDLRPDGGARRRLRDHCERRDL